MVCVWVACNCCFGPVLTVVLPFMPRYIGTLNVTHRDFTTTSSPQSDPSAPPSPLTISPKVRSPAIQPQGSTTPTRTATPLPEVQIDKNRHVLPPPPPPYPTKLPLALNGLPTVQFCAPFVFSLICLDHPEMVARGFRKEKFVLYRIINHKTPIKTIPFGTWCRWCNNHKL